MAQSSQPKRISLKVNPTKTTKIQNALDLLEAQFGDIGKVWKRLSHPQRKALRASSPMLDQFIRLARKFSRDDKDKE